MPEEVIGRFGVGDSVDVFFDSLSQTLSMTVHQVGETQEGQAVVVLTSTENDSQAQDLRQESGRVIFYSSEGIRVPKEALRVNADGEQGVYVVVSQKAKFRPVSILAEDENSYLVKAAPTDETDTRELKAGDEIILAAEELYDGKVVR